MNRKLFSILSTSILVASTALAQGAHGPGVPGTGNTGATRTGLNMTAQTTIEGSISSVQVAFGTQYPSIVVNKIQIKVAPVWFLLESDFELVAGDAVSVVAAPSNDASDTYLYAIRITKSASSIALRDELGVPLWTGRGEGRGSNPQGPSIIGTCIDLASIQTATGVIDRVNAGAGIQQPTLVLRLANATLLTLKLGSERLILASDFELNPGATLTVKYALATCTDELVAMQLTNANGETLTLRN